MAPAPPRVNKVDLKSLDPLDPLLELMYFGLKGMTREADAVLARHGLSRVHHRVLFVLARRDRVSVGELQATLGVTKQALNRPLRTLVSASLVHAERDPDHHRTKLLRLTPAGLALEVEASECERRVMTAALERFAPAERAAWSSIMAAIAAHA